jgi:N-acetylglutamate synthase-like GNAT family acetyltransferase
LIAELSGMRVGCAFCVAGAAADTAMLRILLVDPAARGRRIGHDLVGQTWAVQLDATA